MNTSLDKLSYVSIKTTTNLQPTLKSDDQQVAMNIIKNIICIKLSGTAYGSLLLLARVRSRIKLLETDFFWHPPQKEKRVHATFSPCKDQQFSCPHSIPHPFHKIKFTSIQYMLKCFCFLDLTHSYQNDTPKNQPCSLPCKQDCNKCCAPCKHQTSIF